MNNLILFNGNKNDYRKLSIAEKNEFKKKQIVNYFTNFLLDNKVEHHEDRVAMILAFDQLEPRDLTDAYLCANIVYCQHIIGELNKYKENYQKYELSSKRSSRRYRWAIREYSNLVNTLTKMIKSRQEYKPKIKEQEDDK